MKIRRAVKDDLEAVNSLLRQVLKVHHDGRPDLFRAEGKKYTNAELLEIFSNPDTPVFVYEEDGIVLGYAFCALQHQESGSLMPIMLLTAKSMPEDKHTGFLVGTDDYMVKPVDRQEMVLRIKALLRRARIVDEHRITIGDVIFDYDSHSVRRGYDVQVLPPKEFNLLYKLLAYPERTFTRLELLDEIWGMDSESDEKTVNVHINRLRTRFYDWPEFEIQTIRGMGYRAVRKQ